jgi:hypothetical protein
MVAKYHIKENFGRSDSRDGRLDGRNMAKLAQPIHKNHNAGVAGGIGW